MEFLPVIRQIKWVCFSLNPGKRIEIHYFRRSCGTASSNERSIFVWTHWCIGVVIFKWYWLFDYWTIISKKIIAVPMNQFKRTFDTLANRRVNLYCCTSIFSRLHQNGMHGNLHISNFDREHQYLSVRSRLIPWSSCSMHHHHQEYTIDYSCLQYRLF